MLTVRGGLRFGLMLLTVGEAATLAGWLVGLWHSVGWSWPAVALASPWAAWVPRGALAALAVWALATLALAPYASVATAW